MALDTTIGGAAADSYATYAEFTTYATAQGWTLVGTQAVLEGYMRRAVLSIDIGYTFAGTRQYQTQARDWPRVNVGDVDGWYVAADTIPSPIKQAQMELAYAVMGGGAVLPAVTGLVASERVWAGPVGSDTTYQGGALPETRYLAVDRLLAPYVIAGAGTVRVVRG